MELADTSVWAWTRRRSLGALREWFDSEVGAGRIATCEMVKLELLHGARDQAEFDMLDDRFGGLPDCHIGPIEWARARGVYRRLAAVSPGFQRTVGHPDLLIAAAAESAGVTLLHYDSDYDAIAEITGQPARWVAPRGSLG